MAAALDPSPRAGGIFERTLNSKPSAGCRRSKARTQRLSRLDGIGRSECKANSPVSDTSSSRCSDSAAAMQSKPGPRFAEDAGTRTRRLRITQHRFLDRGELGGAGDPPPAVVGDPRPGGPPPPPGPPPNRLPRPPGPPLEHPPPPRPRTALAEN